MVSGIFLYELELLCSCFTLQADIYFFSFYQGIVIAMVLSLSCFVMQLNDMAPLQRSGGILLCKCRSVRR